MSGRQNYFYYNTIKNLITAFGIIFSDVVYVNDFGNTIKVPLHYAPREKFIEFIQVKTDYDGAVDTDTTLPRMGFELTSIDYDSSRALNPMSKMKDTADINGNYMYNRVPYMFTFMLYIGARKFEDSLKIIEQIVPFFTPEMNVSIRDKNDFGIATDVPFILNNAGFMIDWQGSFETRRTVLWTLDFSAKAFLYSNVREQKRIKETILTMEDKDFARVYESFVSEISPRDANREDPHTVYDRAFDGPPPTKLSFDITAGQSTEVDSSDDEPFTVLLLTPIFHGQTAHLVETLYTGSNTFDLSLNEGDESTLNL
jgi:hypothetical protein